MKRKKKLLKQRNAVHQWKSSSEPVCLTEKNTDEFRQNTDKNLSTDDKYKDEVTLVDANS